MGDKAKMRGELIGFRLGRWCGDVLQALGKLRLFKALGRLLEQVTLLELLLALSIGLFVGCWTYLFLEL